MCFSRSDPPPLMAQEHGLSRYKSAPTRLARSPSMRGSRAAAVSAATPLNAHTATSAHALRLHPRPCAIVASWSIPDPKWHRACMNAGDSDGFPLRLTISLAGYAATLCRPRELGRSARSTPLPSLRSLFRSSHSRSLRWLRPDRPSDRHLRICHGPRPPKAETNPAVGHYVFALDSRSAAQFYPGRDTSSPEEISMSSSPLNNASNSASRAAATRSHSLSRATI